MRDRLLRSYLRVAPLSRAVIRSREVELLAGLALAGPVVDLGHGDGTFAAELSRAGLAVAVGVDLDGCELVRAAKTARRRGARVALVRAAMERLPFRDGAFGGAISNCVLEPLTDAEAAVREAARVVRPGGRVAATVVTDRYLPMMARPRILRALGLAPLARRYEEVVTRWFVHRRYW